MKVHRKKKTKKVYALALSGGAALGSYQAGAIRALYEEGLNIRYVAGSSIGALNGYLAATGEIEAMLSFWKDLDSRKMITMNSFAKLFFSGTPSLLTDAMQRDLIYKQVRIENLKKANREYVCTAISLKTGALHYFSGHEAENDGELQNYILASAAVPGVFPPVEIGNDLFMDGGLVRNTPIEPLEQKRVDAVIAISMEPAEYPVEKIQNTGQMALKTISIFFRTQAEDAAQHALNSKKRRAKKILLLRPRLPLDMQQYEFDRKKIAMLMEQGYAEGLEFIAKNKL